MYFLNFIFDYGNKTFKFMVSEKWGYSSQTEFYNLSLYLKTFRRFSNLTLKIFVFRSCFLNIKYAISFKFFVD